MLPSGGQYFLTDYVRVLRNVNVWNGHGCRYDWGWGALSILTVMVV